MSTLGVGHRERDSVGGIPMARRRGFFAEMAHQAAVADRNRQRATAAAVKEQARRQREAERLGAQAERSNKRETVMQEKEMRQLHMAAQEAEVERLNGELALHLADIDNVLSATLEVDDFVDLERLRQVVEHPPFESRYLTPVPALVPIAAPPEPVFVEPEPARGVGAMFGGKKKHRGGGRCAGRLRTSARAVAAGRSCHPNEAVGAAVRAEQGRADEASRVGV